MNKRQNKKLNCPKCGHRMRQFAIRLKHKHDYDLCKICHLNERKLMREIMTEIGRTNPVLGAFINNPWFGSFM